MNGKYSDNSALCGIPTVQNHISDIYSKAASAKYFTLSAAKSVIEADPMAQANVLAARIHASSMAVDVCTTAMKIGGGTAYAKRINIRKTFKRFSSCGCLWHHYLMFLQLGLEGF